MPKAVVETGAGRGLGYAARSDLEETGGKLEV